MVDTLENYRENLRHVVRPDDTREREESTRILLADYQALALQRMLRVYAAYSAAGEMEGIARAYIEYIDMVVRDEGRRDVYIYAHTWEAKQVIQDAFFMHGEEVKMEISIPDF